MWTALFGHFTAGARSRRIGTLGTIGSTPAWTRWQFLPAINGDLDNDNDVDAADRAIVLGFRNSSAATPGDRRDVARDGVINLRDARIFALTACAVGTCAPR